MNRNKDITDNKNLKNKIIKKPKKIKVKSEGLFKINKNKNDSDTPSSDESNSDNLNTSDNDESLSDDVDSNKKFINSNEIFKSLIVNQRKNVQMAWRLNDNDIKRICKYINKSIFDKEKCCLWNGYITNSELDKASHRGTYINFYFKNKKVALHRLLYINFIDTLDDSEYLKFTCENKGYCCNVN